MLKVKLLTDTAKMPAIGHPGEDLGYDLYAAESAVIPPRGWVDIGSGVAAEFSLPHEDGLRFGFIVQEKSSYAKRKIFVMGGVIDSGYRGEIRIMLANVSDEEQVIKAGEKVANLIPIPVVANKVMVVSDLTPSLRGESGFGSTGLND